MALKILLINPNTNKSPPVPPVGLEYLSSALKKHDYNCDILDLTFAEKPLEEIKDILSNKSYDIIGFSIRNIDSCLFFNNEFFLDEFKKMIDHIKDYNIPVVLGGSGFSAMPDEILEYLKADFGIIGPGEIVFPYFLKLWESNRLNKKIMNGWDYGLDDELEMSRAKEIKYNRYIENGGIVGFSTHAGCSNGCPYCIEANKKVYYRKIKSVINEIEFLVKQGYDYFHLCDSEFNENLNYSKKFCEAIIESSINFKWTLYMKPSPYDEELFRLLNKTNAHLITLSVESDKNIQSQNNYSYNDLEEIIQYCKKYNIDLAIDLLTGYPEESFQSTKKVVEFFKKNRPKTVGINFYYRLFKNTKLSHLIRENPLMQKQLTRPYSEKEDYLIPIFYSQYKKEDIEELIRDDNLFKIPGITPGVNYQQE
jgi:radical SAM superfamily enzyme YgiQ (UPF0313 family)